MAQPYTAQYMRLQALRDQLDNESEEVMSTFAKFQGRVMATGAISQHIKQLMALSIVIAQCCDSCILTYVHDALKAGATRNEILETIGVATLMGGAPAAACGSEALEALNQL